MEPYPSGIRLGSEGLASNRGRGAAAGLPPSPPLSFLDGGVRRGFDSFAYVGAWPREFRRVEKLRGRARLMGANEQSSSELATDSGNPTV